MSDFLNKLKDDVDAIGKKLVETWGDPVGVEIHSVLSRLVGLFEAGVTAAAPVVEKDLMVEGRKVGEAIAEYGAEML